MLPLVAEEQRERDQHGRQRERPRAAEQIGERRGGAAERERDDGPRHVREPRRRAAHGRGVAGYAFRQVQHQLRDGARHQRRRQRIRQVQPMNRVLDRHRHHERHPGRDRGPRVAVRERAQTDRERGARDEQQPLHAEQDLQRGRMRTQHQAARHAGREHDAAKHGQREQLRDRARAAGHQRGAQRDEVARHVRREQALQREKARGVDIAAVERQQRGKIRFHGVGVPGKNGRRGRGPRSQFAVPVRSPNPRSARRVGARRAARAGARRATRERRTSRGTPRAPRRTGYRDIGTAGYRDIEQRSSGATPQRRMLRTAAAPRVRVTPTRR